MRDHESTDLEAADYLSRQDAWPDDPDYGPDDFLEDHYEREQRERVDGYEMLSDHPAIHDPF